MILLWFKLKIKRVGSWLLDLFFPLTCLGCDQEGTLACGRCLALVPEPDSQVCPECQAPFRPNGAVCDRCRSKTYLDGLFVARAYHFRLVKVLVHALKYRFLEAAAVPLVFLLEESLAHHTLPLPDLILPVPLHPRRLRWRGFNQATLIAMLLRARLAPGLELSIDTESLRRVRFTKPQIQTEKRAERLENLTDAFEVTHLVAGPLIGKYIWLIDDVATTGTTLGQCAKALKQAGVRKVWGVVIAR